MRSFTLHCTVGAALLLLPALAGCAQSPSLHTLAVMDQPFLFAYGTWDKRAVINNGAARLTADGLTPKGGAGRNQPLNLTADADDCPALRLSVGPRNTLKHLRLMLTDAQGHTGLWQFTLPPPGATVRVTPDDGAALSRPNEPGKSGPPDLSKVMQWQLMGDWGGDGPVDVTVAAIEALPPDAAIRQAREARAVQDTQAQAKARQERAAAQEKYPPGLPNAPTVEAVYAAAPDVLAVQIQAGHVTPTHLEAYRPLPGDTRKAQGASTILVRQGQDFGYLIGPKKDGLVPIEGFVGDPLLTAEADDPANYRVRSADDPAFAAGIAPAQVSRKAKADDWQQPKRPGIAVRHIVYLRLPHALTPGKTYTVTFGHLNTRQAQTIFAFQPNHLWSEAVHVSQVGFRPDDPRKRAFLSLWMGVGGGYEYAPGLPFHLVNAVTGKAVTGKAVYTGRAGAAWPADKPETMGRTANFNGTSVTPLDFSDFRTPGRYRVVVDGVGCSYPFEIGAQTWAKAFQTQMQGFYNQRSGIALGPPYTPFVRPRDFRPGDPGVSVTQSTYSILDGGDVQHDLAKGDTGKPVPGAWGGYHDAGDWNPRRISHMRTTTFWQLELLELFPAYFRSLPLSIPKEKGLPDLLTECLFELSLFHRLQNAAGGVSFGIETDGDPADTEVSWKQSMPAFVYAPDVQSSYFYAAVAARASRVLMAYNPKEATEYRDSALRAMRWAESGRAKRQAAGTWAKLPGDVTDDRALAAVELYATTRDPQWDTVFREDTALKPAAPLVFYGNQTRRDAAFAYARLPQNAGDPALKAAARRALLADADGSLAYESHNAWGIASDDPGKPQFLGFYSAPHGAVSLARAYTLTHDTKYLAGAVQATLFPAGANPNNMVYTSDVGANPVRHPLNLDSRWTGQPAPAGITVYGNVDLTKWNQTWITWPITYYLNAVSQPSLYDWPTTEAYFDVFFMPALNELTMDQTMGPNAYVWGYLAARG